MSVHFQSDKQDWETPQDFFEELDDEFHFTIDVCATAYNTKVFACYFSPTDDALTSDWEGVCWMNPPYGREIGKWMKKAYEESQKGSTVVCLVPSRTDTAWWHDYAMKGEIRFIRGRLKFVGAENSAPFPSAIVVFTQKDELIAELLEALRDLSGAIDAVGYDPNSIVRPAWLNAAKAIRKAKE